MKAAVVLVLLACVVCLSQAQSCPDECGEGKCCAGGSFARRCRSLGDNGEQCEPPNRFNQYSTACPCKEGLICSAIRRCQGA